jgi:hypothetical protein
MSISPGRLRDGDIKDVSCWLMPVILATQEAEIRKITV